MIEQMISLRAASASLTTAPNGASMYFQRFPYSGYGFSVRPVMDKSEFNPIGTPDPSSYAYVAAANFLPTIPMSFPIYVQVTFADGSYNFIRVMDTRLHRFGKKFKELTFYSMGTAIKKTLVINGCTTYALVKVLEYQDETMDPYDSKEWRDVVRLFPARFSNGSSITHFYLLDASVAGGSGTYNGSPVVIRPINWFGMSDEITATGASQQVGAFYLFEQYKTWRIVLAPANGGAAQDINLYTLDQALGLSAESAVLNEVIPAASWSGNILVLERTVEYADEWVLLSGTDGGTNHIEVISAHAVTGF